MSDKESTSKSRQLQNSKKSFDVKDSKDKFMSERERPVSGR
jgi:hypothetical protein